jgi:2-C-methyl-D-erythritol 2,4-cyclodiphosphate synthase
MSNDIRIGTGFDAHPLVSGRRLVLGGVEIPFDKGLDGWSDADVLVHAIMDALLGSLALGDIGMHFPPGDPQYKGISSIVLLKKVGSLLKKQGWRTNNIDATIIAERPRLRDYIDNMRQNVAAALELDLTKVSVKASTANTLGFVGRGDGMAAIAVVTVAKNK